MQWNIKGVVLLAAASGWGAQAQDLPPAPSNPVAAPAPVLPDGVEATGPAGTSGAAKRYDTVGYAGVGAGGGTAVTATSGMLPLGAFAEVTALDTGTTILLRIAEGSPERADRLIALSPAAARLLGIGGAAAAVRVREVDAPDVDAVALREGRAASARMDAPPVLLVGLRKLLDAKKAPAAATETAAAGKATTPAKPAPAPATKPPAVGPSAGGDYQVQVAAFSTRDRADRVAKAIHGSVQPAGRYFRVRLGPFKTRADADRARDAAAKRGYGDARVLTDD